MLHRCSHAFVSSVVPISLRELISFLKSICVSNWTLSSHHFCHALFSIFSPHFSAEIEINMVSNLIRFDRNDKRPSTHFDPLEHCLQHANTFQFSLCNQKFFLFILYFRCQLMFLLFAQFLQMLFFSALFTHSLLFEFF